MDQDTSPSQAARYYERLRAMTPAQRAATTRLLCRSVRRLAVLGLRQHHPEASDAEIRARLFVRLYGRTEAIRVLGEVPDDAV